MNSVIVSLIGSRQHYAVPRAFQRAGVLRAFLPDIWVHPRAGQLLSRYGGRTGKRLAGRFHDALDRETVKPIGGSWCYNLIERLPALRGNLYEFYCRQGRAFSRGVNRELRRMELDPREDVFFGFSSACLETLLFLKECGIRTLIDQIDPLCTEFEIVAAERRRWPGWELAKPEVPQEYIARVQQEWHTASHVLVNSDWTRRALLEQGVSDDKIIVVPQAYENEVSSRECAYDGKRPLRILWLGRAILRKGIQYLMAAADSLGRDVEIRVVGSIGIEANKVAAAPKNMRFCGPVPRTQVTSEYEWADVFVFPTLSDGFAVTQLEAMANGLPVVTTTHCGRVVEDGQSGLIVRAGDSDSLATALARLAAQPDTVNAMSAAALSAVAEYTLERFASNVLAGLAGKP